MTISSNDDPKAGPYNGNDSQTVFPFSFRSFLSTDLLVIRTDEDGVEHDLVPGSDYSVSLNADQNANPGGSVTYPISGTPLPTGETLTIVSDLEYLQPLNLLNGGNFSPSAQNSAFDRVTMLVKQVKEKVSRALQLAVSTPAGVDVTLPVPEASKVIGWSADGTSLANFAADTSVSTDLFADRLADPSSASNGDARLGVKSTLSDTEATTQHEVNERTRHVFDWMTPVQRAAAVSNLGVTDLTAPLQAAIDSGENIDFGSCVMRISKLTFDQNGKTYRFNGAQLVAGDSGAQMGMIDWQAAYCVVYGMNLVGAWLDNYTSAIYWHSASAGAPAKSNHFYDLAINNALIGILFGEVSPTVPVDAAQSENYIFGMRTRGVERTIYGNQSNGFLKIIGGEVASSKNEWDIQNPGVYDYTQAAAIQLLQGVIAVVGGDVIKTDTQLGSGLINSGGTLSISGGTNLEIASRIFTGSGGYTMISDVSGSYWGNAAADWCSLSGTSGSLVLCNVTINKDVAAAAANQALVNFASTSVSGWDVVLDNVRAENQLNWIFTTSNATPNRWSNNTVTFKNCSAPASAGAAASNPFARVSSATENLLDLRGTDTNGNDIATWYKRDISGVGAIALNADVPSGTNYPNSIMVTPAVTTGSSEVTNMDLTSLTTVKATAVKCRPGDNFMLSGWFRMTTSGTAQVDVTYANAAGAASSSAPLANQADLLTSSWQYIEAMFTVPASAAYLGVGIRGSSGTVCRMVGLKLSKLS